MIWGTSRLMALLLAAVGIALLWHACARAATPREVRRMVIEEALNSRVPPSLALAVAHVESNFRDRAESAAGARGVMQIMPATAISEFGVMPDELWDARLNIQLGIHFLEQLIARYGGRWDAALSHYNGGSLRGSGRHVAPHPYTRDYVASVLRWQRTYAAQAALWREDLEPRRSAFEPARTRTVAVDAAAHPAPPAGDNSARAAASISEAPQTTAQQTAPRAAKPGADDGLSALERRRRANRWRLDDFRPRVRWDSG